MAHERLFAPLSIGQHAIKNPIVFPPTASVTGIVTDAGLAWYERIAAGGVGTIIVEGTHLGTFDTEEFVHRLPLLAATIHRHQALACIQLFQPPHLPDGTPISVSGGEAGRGLTTEEVAQIPARFAHAAKTACDAGFDAVEAHGAHGFLLNQFFSAKANRRDDTYGAGLGGRMRLGLEVVQAVRASVAPDALVFYRHTPEQEGGYTLDESMEFAAALEAAGLDVLDVSPSTRGVAPREVREPVGPHAGLAEAFRDAVDCPIMAVGGMNDPDRAVAALERGKVQLVGICRGLIADALWPHKVQEGRVDEIVQCVECNAKCFGNLFKGEPIACTQWRSG